MGIRLPEHVLLFTGSTRAVQSLFKIVYNEKYSELVVLYSSGVWRRVCLRGKYFSLINLDKYYRFYWWNTDVSTKIHHFFISTRDFCNLSRFLRGHIGSQVACVLQANRTHLPMVTVCLKVKFKKYRYFFLYNYFLHKSISRKGIVLKQKRGGIENTAPPQPNCC